MLYDATGTATDSVSEQAAIVATATVWIAPGSGYYSTLLCQIARQLERGSLQPAAGLINQFLSLTF